MNCVACGAPHSPAEVSCSYCLSTLPKPVDSGWHDFFYGPYTVENPCPPPERTFAERADAFLGFLESFPKSTHP